jgi:predicted amino acid racemase
MKIGAESGGTHQEPGHAFTGTAPIHAFRDMPELPAMVFVSEVIQTLGTKAFVVSGNVVVDSVLGVTNIIGNPHRVIKTIVGDEPDSIPSQPLTSIPSEGYYDFTIESAYGEYRPKVGDSAVYSFRAQISAGTRVRVAVVTGIGKMKPKVIGTFDSFGNLVDEHNRPLPDSEVLNLMSRI